MGSTEAETETAPALFLVPIGRDCAVRGIARPNALGDVLRQAAALYLTVGFRQPWIGYLALLGGRAVGMCAFKSAPENGRVEIAHYTFAEVEGRNVAASMVRGMVEIARANDPTITVATQH